MADWQLPGYIEVETLGVGGFGRVVLAKHQPSGSLVAIKYLHQRFLADPRIVGSFRHEASMLAAVPSPYVVRLYDFVHTREGAALVMEAVPGVSLRAILAADGTLAPESALAVLKGSLLGLAAAHSVGVVHRDYKPDNVLVNDQGVSKLVDFGLAVLDGQQGLAAGSPAYMAPEQWAGQPGTPATDVYAATCVFFQCVTGERPFSGDTSAEFRQLHEQAPVPLAAVPEALRGLVARGLAKHPAQRPPTADAFVADLQAAAVAGYGEDWEQRGWRALAARALALLAVTPLALLATTATAAAPIGGGTAAAGVGAGAAGTATAAGSAGVGTGAAGTAAAAGSTGVGAGAGTVSGGLLATATAKVTAAAVTVVALGVGGVVAYNAIASDDPERPPVQEQIEPLYAFQTQSGFGVANGTKVVGQSPQVTISRLRFTDDRRFVFSATDGSVHALDTRSGKHQQVNCGGCMWAVPVSDSEVAWLNDGADFGVVIVDLAKPRSAVRTLAIDLPDLPSEPEVPGPPELVAGAGGTIVVAVPTNPAGYDATHLYFVDGDDGSVRQVRAEEPVANGSFAFNADGSKLAFNTGSRSEACTGDVRAAEIDVASGTVRELPPVETVEQAFGEGRGLYDLWWSGGQLYGIYERTLCNRDGSTEAQVKPSVWRLTDGRWVEVADNPRTRRVGRDGAALVQGSDAVEGLGTLYFETDGKRTKVVDGAASILTPST